MIVQANTVQKTISHISWTMYMQVLFRLYGWLGCLEHVNQDKQREQTVLSGVWRGDKPVCILVWTRD